MCYICWPAPQSGYSPPNISMKLFGVSLMTILIQASQTAFPLYEKAWGVPQIILKLSMDGDTGLSIVYHIVAKHVDKLLIVPRFYPIPPELYVL